jgi:hypothetical protein
MAIAFPKKRDFHESALHSLRFGGTGLRWVAVNASYILLSFLDINVGKVPGCQE